MSTAGPSHQYWPGQIGRGLSTGILTGLLISLYSQMVFSLTALNRSHGWLVLMIIPGAMLTQLVYRLFGDRLRNSTTGDAIEAINSHNWAQSQAEAGLSPWMGLVAFIGAGITHLVGASGGKEGAGVQIGLASAALVEKAEDRIAGQIGYIHDSRRDHYLIAGAAAAFAALFDAPVAGVFFGTQLASPKSTRMDAYLSAVFAAFSSSIISQATGCHVMAIPPVTPLAPEITNIAPVVVFALLTGLYARLFCYVLGHVRTFFQTHVKSHYLAVAAPAAILMAISLATWAFSGSFRYNGLGTDLLWDIISDQAREIDDIVKLMMVAFTFAAGFVGGEVVPLLIVGAGFGMSFSHLIDGPTSAYATLGALGMLAGGTNLPLVCFALGLELFGYSEPSLLFVMCALSWLSSGRSGIYAHQHLPYR